MARIVIAPDSFKGSADAAGVAAALAEGWRDVRGDDALILVPMADGGEGTLDAFAAAWPEAERRSVSVAGPVGDPVDAPWLWRPEASDPSGTSRSGGTAVVELASTSGITLLDRLQPWDAHTVGFGQAIAQALDAGAERLILAVGGSASTDGGAGMLTALGARLDDASGAAVPAGNRGLASAQSLRLEGLRPLPRGGVTVITDVTSPLLGPGGAAHAFGAQKGADEDARRGMDENLGRLAALASVDPATPGTGAAGGTVFGLLLWAQAAGAGTDGVRILAGSEAVADAIGLGRALDAADVVVTGEGRYDEQSRLGKVPAYVLGEAKHRSAARKAEQEPVRAMLVAGSIAAPTTDFDVAVSLSDLAGDAARAIANPAVYLREAGRVLANARSTDTDFGSRRAQPGRPKRR